MFHFLTRLFYTWHCLTPFLFAILSSLNSSPIDELGEGAYEGGLWCQAKCEHRAGHAGIHGNPESGNHHQAPVTLINSVEILSNLYTYHGQPREREGKGQTAAQMHKCTNTSSKLHDLQSEYASSNAKRRPVCWIGAHDRERR